MHRYTGNSTKGKARAHYGDFHGNTTYNNGDVHGNTIYNLTLNQRPDESDDDLDQALILSSRNVRPLDARFDGDERAIELWQKKNNLQISKLRRTEDVQSLIDRMSKYSVYRTYQRLASRKLSGTTRWVLERPELKDWLESTCGAQLFLVGKVGSGKTTLMTTIIEKALEVSYPKSAVLSFFFEDQASAAVDLFASLTQQLLRHMVAAGVSVSEKIRLAIEELYNEGPIRPTLREIQTELFEPILQYFPGCFIVIDGISSASVSPIARYFRKLREDAMIKILISTRDDLDLPVDAMKIVLAGDAYGSSHNDEDIRKYVDMKLEDQARPGKLLENESLRGLVRHELLRNAKGMFLWVVMQIQYLFGRDEDEGGVCQTANDVQSYIKEMPPSLSGIYENCLRHQPGSQRRYTAQILRWVCASPEPVHIDNMRELLAFDLETRMLSESVMPPRGGILRAATNLVILESSDSATGPEATSRNYLLPMHSTVRDFLFSTDGQSVVNEVTGNVAMWTQPDTVLELGGICAAYLLAFSGREVVRNREVFSHVPSIPTLKKVYDTSLSSGMARIAKQTTGWLFQAPEKHSAQMKRLRPPPTEMLEERLLEFARRNWLLCLRHAEKNSQQYKDFKALVFEQADTPHRPWAQQHKSSTKRSRLESLLFWAISNDHAPLLELAIEEDSQEKVLPTRFWTEPLAECAGVPLLHFAARRCSEGVISLLLPLCCGKSSYKRSTALHCAVESASVDVVLLLLRYVQGTRSPYRTLLDKDTNGRLAFHLAVMRNDDGLCSALSFVTKEAIVSEYDARNATKRHPPASDWIDVQLPRFLLDRAMRSPLYYALLSGSPGMVKIIMDAGLILPQDVRIDGTLTSFLDVASYDLVASVIRRLLTTKEHEDLIRPHLGAWEGLVVIFGLKEDLGVRSGIMGALLSSSMDEESAAGNHA